MDEKANRIMQKLDELSRDLEFMGTDGAGWTDKTMKIQYETINAIKEIIDDTV